MEIKLNKKKILSFIFCIQVLISRHFISAQEASNSAEGRAVSEAPSSAEAVIESNEGEAKSPSPFGFYFGSEVVISATGRTADPPAGVSLNLGGEYEYRILKHLSIAPSLDFSFFHYGWISGKTAEKLPLNKAYICETENRTALTFAFLLDMPVLAVFDVKDWTVSFGGGLSFLTRFGVLEPGVKPEEKGRDGGLPAKEELKKINAYFWENGRFFYPSFRFKTEYTFASGWKTGIQLKAFLPVFNLWDKEAPKFSDGMIIQIGVILHPAKRK